MPKKITILTGAGFTVLPHFAGINTQNLTDGIRGINIPNCMIAGKTPGEYFYRKLCFHYTGKTKNDCDLSTVNFETIIHLLEELYTHLVSFISGRKNIIPDYKGVKPAFLKLHQSISTDLESTKIAMGKRFKYEIIIDIYRHFIDFIINQFKVYNLSKTNKGMNDFYKLFLRKYLKNASWYKRIYTLNYDSWLNSFKNYYDGFDSNGDFESAKVMNDSDFNCHYNLHGCVLWQNEIQKNNIKKKKHAVNFKSYVQSSAYGINREPLLATPIITGYHKLERMKYNPYLQFYFSFQRDLLDSDLLLIIGYSFTDTHVNNLLALYEGKTIVVNYLKVWDDAEKSVKNNLKPTQVFSYNNVTYDLNDADVQKLYNLLEPSNGGFDPKEEIFPGWVESKNGKTRLWWRGIGNEFYNNWNALIV
ncbi:MAG: SIR2 family protein [Bacteroidetes bacterium]|nr:SIR2 family protein [Bacteroidota bacterium]